MGILDRIERLFYGASAEEAATRRLALLVTLLDVHIDRAVERLLDDLVDDETTANVASIQAIPQEQLPDAEARAELIRRAQAGEDVYAYIPVGNDGQYVVWVRCDNPAHDCRYVPAEWAHDWRASLNSQERGVQ